MDNALHLASRDGHLEIVQLLLYHRADMIIRDDDGETAQMAAYRYDFVIENGQADGLEANNIDGDDDYWISELRERASRCLEVADLLEKWPSFMGALMMTELGVYHLVDMSMLDL